MQKHLKRLAHRILSAQEDKRKRISHDLQDEIAQTLLGINARLLTVKKASGRSARSLQKEIANTQGLVDMSVKTIKRLAREFGKPHQA
jgi:signal transduction histidine kinase